MADYLENSQLGLRRRRRAIPDDPAERGPFENPALRNIDGENNLRPILRQDPAVPAAAPRWMPPADSLPDQGPTPPVPPRRPPSDVQQRNPHFLSRRVSRLYSVLSTCFAILAIVVTSTKHATNFEFDSQYSSSGSTQWSSVEQVAKAAAVGMAAKRGEAENIDTTDMLQSIQQWWNAQQDRGTNADEKAKKYRDSMPSPFWWWRHNRQKDPNANQFTKNSGAASFFPQGVLNSANEAIWTWFDLSIFLNPKSTTPTDILEKILTSTPRLLAIANFLLAMTYLVHSAVAKWFLGNESNVSTGGRGGDVNIPGSVDWNNPVRERMGGFLIFKLLLVSAVVAPDTLDLMILLTWYTTLGCLRSLDHLANATTTHLSALGQPPRSGVVKLLFLVLVGDIIAAASCVALFHAAGLGMVLLLTCDCALLAADVISHILKHFVCVIEEIHSQTIQAMEARQIELHNAINNNNNNIHGSADQDNDSADDGVSLERRQHIHNEDEDELDNEMNEDDAGNMTSPSWAIQESRRLDRQMEVFDLAHTRRVGIMENIIFGLELLCYAMTVAHFFHIWSFHGVHFTLIDGVLALHLHSAISSALRKIAQRRNIHAITRDLHGTFPNATDEELRKASTAGDVCCICLGTMSTSTQHVKKLPCGHLYHTHCLREVVERAQSLQAAKCPLCRSSLLDGGRDAQPEADRRAPTNNATQPAARADEAELHAATPHGGIVAPGDRALFRFSTEGVVPAWIPVPAFSFEVVRRAPTVGPAPAPVPVIGGARHIPAEHVPDPNQGIIDNAPVGDPGGVQNDSMGVVDGFDTLSPQRMQQPLQEGARQETVEAAPSFLRRFLILAGAIPMSPEEESQALAQLVDMFPQYERNHLLNELRERGSSEAVAEAILVGAFRSGAPIG